ncbi:MAG: N-6 DNA methylase, partial [candidate division NC10 bacterium]|nr:N-6 DNA methylase [candidate division NC10 bacterium]
MYYLVMVQEGAKRAVQRLVEKFERESTAGAIYEYNEPETKAGFIEPFLQALSWNTQDRNEVGLETKVSGGRVDYSLKIHGTPRIYVEAKPLKADLAKPDIVEQAITYGYNKKAVKWVLLTDFQELRLFDVTLKPSKRNLERGLRLDLRYTEYLDRFDDLWLLSRPSVETGDLDRALLTKKAERDRLPVDKAILEDLKRWQETLAKDIYKRSNYGLEADRLREAAQRILDRIIFIRSCEDRKLTHAESLRDLVLQRRDEIGIDFMLVLKGLFRRYDRDFNSDLFTPHFSEDLAVDFPVLKEIILETYEPYLFDVVGIELLGSIYEQYLGYTINLTDKRVKYDLKPEVRKAGGVYYTPEYIVDYIVRNTVGRLLENRVKGRGGKEKPLRILDPACGSGSFLIRAYDELMRHYEAMKAEALRKKAEALKATRADQFAFPLAAEEEEVSPRLTIMQKRQMVLDHLFGVDIDPQACEITRLSLMLKMLEDEYGIVPGRAVLPLLNYNIQFGNSLVSGDVLKLQSFFKEAWIKTKSFDWEDRFRTIMKEGGFDVIIGNPPYVRIQDLQTWAPAEARFYAEHFESAGKGNF